MSAPAGIGVGLDVIDFDYAKPLGKPVVGFVLCRDGDGAAFTMIGDPLLVAAWQAAGENATRRKLRTLQRLLNRGRWFRKSGWPGDWESIPEVSTR